MIVEKYPLKPKDSNLLQTMSYFGLSMFLCIPIYWAFIGYSQDTWECQLNYIFNPIQYELHWSPCWVFVTHGPVGTRPYIKNIKNRCGGDHYLFIYTFISNYTTF